MNLLLVLTALLTSLTGIISGERAATARVQANARSVEQVATAVAEHVVVVISPGLHPDGVLYSRIVPLPRTLALAPAAPIFAEKRRE
ncbi:hypothetical protein D1610_12055 [Sphingomonas gilva]|uniref:Uncharacterized protein n=1 Tax=Sphingomonas gilva TaxID=2305907 RepID=A0A396RLM7_9SPHN|nr:hypothetical protein [Sphingomonas gilva]RHW17267.1 hypothetical protein D1610_12055 [Sphingomonas gilva]